ncbi:MAG: hypothetical protein HY071_00235 [Chloroflexi bacterium]|nr:hypothetical protein [Chloroflexota bacterium]
MTRASISPPCGCVVSIHAGEPGASIPATRERIEQGLGCVAFDHPGASEVGAFGFSCSARDGVHLIENEYLVEIVDPVTGASSDEGEGELVLTNLGRWGQPLFVTEREIAYARCAGAARAVGRS